MRKAFLQLHASVFLAGFTGILGRLITLNEALLVWYRLLLTCIALWIIFLLSKKKDSVPTKVRFSIYAVGFIAALHWITFYGSIKYSNVSVALVCFSSIGFFTAIMEPVILRKRINFVELFLGLMTIAGIYIIFHFDPQYKTGIIIGLISAWLCSLFPVYNRRFLQTYDAETVTRHELTGGLYSVTLLLPLYLWIFPTENIFPSMSDWGWLLILSLACTVLAFNLTMQALRKISAFTVNLSFNLEPLYGILLAFLIFQENKYLSKDFYWGLGLIILSVLLQTLLIYRKSRSRRTNIPY
ncbi:MAG: DMT family transporter [Flavitalea sp.]